LRRNSMAKHVLVVWLLWQGLSGATGLDVEGPVYIREAFETKGLCEHRASHERRTRNVVVRNHAPHIPVWVCLPVGIDPWKASFE